MDRLVSNPRPETRVYNTAKIRIRPKDDMVYD